MERGIRGDGVTPKSVYRPQSGVKMLGCSPVFVW